jgi:hypothetical protein
MREFLADQEFEDDDSDDEDKQDCKKDIKEQDRKKSSIWKYGPGMYLYFELQETLLKAFCWLSVIGIFMMYIYSSMGGLSYLGDN